MSSDSDSRPGSVVGASGRSDTADVLVVGGGIAGVSVAADLATDHRVVLAEAEPALAHHTTGRSAAVLIDSYGHPLVRELTLASREVLLNPPEDLADGPFCSPRGMLHIATGDQAETLDALGVEHSSMERLDRAGCVELVPALAGGATEGALYEPSAIDIDVAGLHQMYVRAIRRAGGEIRTRSAVTGLEATTSGWRARIGSDHLDVGLVVNASGAWGDAVAALAGVAPIGLEPRRRTAFTITRPARFGDQPWPLVVDVDEQFYFKGEGLDQLLCSPADETLSEATDAKAEEIDVALGIDRINAATDLDIRHVASAWAGLRTFAPDRAPVVGPDPAVPSFFWLVGQGGTGIQTAPGAAALAGRIIRGVSDSGPFSAARLRAG